MATRNFNWPATVVNATNPSIGLTGQPAPTSATEIGGVDSGGDLIAVAVNPDGTIIIDSTLDKNFGVVGANTLRSASEIGNATGAADFNAGPTGVQTLRIEANQGANNATPWTQNLIEIGGVAYSQGQKLSSGSAPVVLSTSQEAILQNSSDDLDVIAAVDFATQTTLAAVNAKLNSLGQKNMAGSVPVAIASDQSNVPVAIAAGTNIIGKVSIDQTTPGTTNGVQVNAALPAGSNVIGALTANQSVNVAQINGVAPLMGAGNTGTGSQRVTIATDQLAIATKSPVNVTGTYAEITNLTTAAQTFTAPAGAIGFILEALSDNTNNIRWKSGAVATISSGMRLEPGRDSSFVPLDANISVIAEAGSNQVVSVQWVGV